MEDLRFTTEEINEFFNKNFIVNLIKQSELYTTEKLVEKMKSSLTFDLKKSKDFLKIDVDDQVKQIFKKIDKILNSLENPFHKEEIYNKIMKTTLRNYFLNFIENCGKITSSNLNLYCRKIEGDQQLFLKIYKNFNLDTQISQFIFNHMIEFLRTNDIDYTLIHILNKHVFLKKIINEENYKKLLKAKINLNKNEIKYLNMYLNSSFKKYQKKTVVLEKVHRILRVYLICLKFTKIMKKVASKAIQRKKELMK